MLILSLFIIAQLNNYLRQHGFGLENSFLYINVLRNAYNGDHEITFQFPDPNSKAFVDKTCSELEKDPKMIRSLQTLMHVYMELLNSTYNKAVKSQAIDTSPCVNAICPGTQIHSIDSSMNSLSLGGMKKSMSMETNVGEADDCDCHRHQREGK